MSKPKLSAKDAALIKKITPKHRAAALVSLQMDAERKQEDASHDHYWGVRTKLPVTAETPAVTACCNAHRNICLRVLVGRKKTAYIQLDTNGLMVSRCGHDTFNAEWFQLVEFTPQQVAKRFLASMAATYYISVEARTLLEEISIHGAPTSTVKENDMSTAQASATTKPKAAKPAATTKPAPKAVKSESKGSKSASKPAAKGKVTPSKAAAPSKPVAKAVKPAAKGKAVKPTAGRSPYAGMKIKALTTETCAREGSIRHLLRKVVLKATDVDTLLTKTVEFEGEEHPITGTIISNMVNLGMIKVS